MTELFEDARSRAGKGDASSEHLTQLFQAGSPGERIFVLGTMQGKPSTRER